MKSKSNTRPLILHDLGDGSWHYNYNIKEVQVTDENGEETTAFEYETVHIWGNPTYEALAPLVIAEKYSPSEETSLINKYNAFAMKMSFNTEDKERYETYLKTVADIKAMIKNDLRNLGLMPPESRTLQEAIAAKIAEIDKYDISTAVNEFYIDGIPMWIDRETRASLLATLTAEEANGRTSTTLWTQTEPPFPVELTITMCRVMLQQLEVYAKDAFGVTQQHKAAVLSMETVQNVDDYDFTVNYPEKLTFNLES
jgi:hypothetical protein